MKTVTVTQLESVISHIIHDTESLDKLKKQSFMGVRSDSVLVELDKRLGNDWMLVKDNPVKLDKDDIAALANSRFFKKMGQKLMMAWALIVVVLAMLTLTVKVLPLSLYYGIAIVVTGIFLVIFSRKQRAEREGLSRAVYGSDKVIVE
jgi:hypothetical protein